MKKLALLALVAVMSFGFVGCAASRLYSQWGMERRGIGYVQEVRKEKENGIIVYSVVIHYKGRPSEPFRTYEPAFLSLNVGDEVSLELSHYETIGGEVVTAEYLASNHKLDKKFPPRTSFCITFK